MYRIVMIDGLYNVEYNGTIVETFYSRTDAEDYIASLIWERDQAFQDVGCEFDEPWMK